MIQIETFERVSWKTSWKCWKYHKIKGFPWKRNIFNPHKFLKLKRKRCRDTIISNAPACSFANCTNFPGVIRENVMPETRSQSLVYTSRICRYVNHCSFIRYLLVYCYSASMPWHATFNWINDYLFSLPVFWLPKRYLRLSC